MDKVALYLHFPWCLSKCPYCDFNSHALKDTLPEQAYLEALLATVDALPDLIKAREIGSIFMGGGTPSLFSPTTIGTLLDQLSMRLKMPKGIECTLEANPGTFERARFQGFRDAGINRFSVGVQSFAPAQLKILGRVHSAEDAKNALACLSQMGVAFNVDLMMALPHQTQAQALADLETALAYAPPHLSWYQLTLEPNTLFYRAPPPLPSDDATMAMMESGAARLTEAGYDHYEVSAYAKPGYACHHNRHVWQYGDYLGIGAGACGKLSWEGAVWRTLCHRHPKTYLQHREMTWTQVSAKDQIFEYYLNRFRLFEPLPFAEVEAHLKQTLDFSQPCYQQAVQQGLLEIYPDHMRVTAHGRAFLNDLVELFLPEEAA
jgi:putative oxygen-independent coproporphyrinogen III oxidase